MKNLHHTTVFLNEAVDSLNIKKNGIYIDATFGYGGHSRLLLSKLNNLGRLYAIDRDKNSVILGKIITDSRFKIFHCNFARLINLIKELNLIGKIDGMILDFGLSSLQINDNKRGFSFMNDGPLDMRMDTSQGITAHEWLLKTNEKKLTFVLKNYGEERFAKKIARAIINKNKSKRISSTSELSKLVSSLIYIKKRFKHPATRTFQAIRIYINNELKEIKIILKDSLKMLSDQGRLSIISFNSLEDRIVKKFIYNNSDCNLPVGIPLTEIELKKFNSKKVKLIKKFLPSKKDIQNNIRSRSAVLRVAEKI